MKLVYLLAVALLWGKQLYAQDLYLGWASEVKSSYSNYSGPSAIDDNDYLSVAGYLPYNGGTLVVQNQQISHLPGGLPGIFIQRYAPNGDFLWMKYIRNAARMGISDIQVDNNGNTYILGGFKDSIDLDPSSNVAMAYAHYSTTTASYNSAYLLKLDSDGNYVWSKTFDGSTLISPYNMRIDAQGQIYLSGTFMYEMDADPGSGRRMLGGRNPVTVMNVFDFFVIKLSALGDLIWAFDIANGGVAGSGSTTYLDGLELDATGIYLLGSSSAPFDVNPDPAVQTILTPVQPYSDLYVIRYNTNGRLMWHRQIGDGSLCRLSSMMVVDNSAIVFSGYAWDSIDFDPGPQVQWADQGYISKIDSSGNTVWGASAAEAYGMTVDRNDNLILTGYFRGRQDFDPSPDSNYLTALGLEEAFITTYNAQGQYVDATSITSSGREYAKAIHATRFGDLYLLGQYRDTFDIDPTSGVKNRISSGGTDAFLLRLKTCASSSALVHDIQSCVPYTWIDGNTYSASNNTAAYAYTNANGCDSVIYLDFELRPLNVTVVQTSGVLTATANYPNVTYQWIDAVTQQPINGATGATFTPTANGNYQVIVSNGTCNETSAVEVVTHLNVQALSNAAFQCYPNPTGGRLFLTLGQPHRDVRIALHDLSGRLLEQQTYGTLAELTYNLPAASPTGVYLLVIYTAEQAPQQFKIMKQ